VKRNEDWPQAVAVKKTANKAMPARLVIFISNTPLRMKTGVAGKGLLFVGIRVSWSPAFRLLTQASASWLMSGKALAAGFERHRRLAPCRWLITAPSDPQRTVTLFGNRKGRIYSL
jgi:hypothetical protein